MKGGAGMKEKLEKYSQYLFPAALILLLIIAIAATVGASSLIRKEMLEKQLSIARQVQNNLDYRFSQHEEFASGIMSSVLPYLNQNESYDQEYREYESMSNQLMAYLGRGMITDIELYVPDEKMYSRQRDLFYPLSALEENAMFAECRTAGVHWVGDSRVRVSFSEEAPAIACVLTAAKRTDFSSLAGAIVLYISVDKFNGVFGIDPTLTGDVFLVDGSGVTLVHPDSEYIGQNILSEEEIALITSGEDGCKMMGMNIISFSKLQEVPWYLIVRTPMNTFSGLSPTGGILLAALWSMTVLFAGFIIVAYIDNAVVGEAIYTLRSMLQDGSRQESPVKRPRLLSKWRLLSSTRLRTEVRQTVQILEQTIESRYHEQLELANYRMQSLQAQIKPHFLYNTLDIIKWMVVEQKYTDSIWTINALSKYLRMSINRDSSIVTLREEMDLAKTYLELIQKRFTGRFAVFFDLEPDCLSCSLPKLILQPIIENALIHGLLYCEKPDAKLEVRAWTEDGALCIEVEDNGSGMDAQTLEHLFDRKPVTGSGYGLSNIKTRLELFGKGAATLEVYSQAGVGTCVSLRLPAMPAPTEPQK